MSSKVLNVLFIEDDLTHLGTLVVHLKTAGYRLRYTVLDGIEGLNESLDHTRFHVVIIDLETLDLDPSTAAAAVACHSPDLPLISVSRSTPQDIALGLGYRDHIPLDDLSRLVPAIDRELRVTQSRQKHQESALRSRNYAQFIVRSVALPLVIIDKQMHIRTANPAFVDMCHLEMSSVTGRPLPDVIPDEWAWGELLERLSSIAAGNGGHLEKYEQPYPSIQGDPGVAWISTCSLLPGSGEEGDEILVTFEDITRQRLIERRAVVSQRMEAVGFLAGGIAHDFNNLLTVILGQAEFLRDDLEEGSHHRSDVEEILAAANRAADLTRQLLAFSRQQVRTVSTIYLNEVLLGMDKLLRRVLGEHIVFETVLSTELASISSDVSQIEQVLLNLIINARDAVGAGGRISVETRMVELDETYGRERGVDVRPGSYVCLIVADNGEGMDGATQQRIFEPFFTTKREGRGTGLGLSTVYGIVKQNQGFVWVYSEPGTGTTFRVYLPAADPVECAAGVKGDVSTQGSANDCRVLLVEDQAALRRMGKTVLTRAGYVVVDASNGREALEIVDSGVHQFDLLVTDAVMPEMGGAELVAALRSRIPDLKVIYMSGFTDDQLVDQGIQVSQVAFLEKPFRPSDLISLVEKIMNIGSVPRPDHGALDQTTGALDQTTGALDQTTGALDQTTEINGCATK